jgi:gliding motility-associated-like protein
MRKSFFNKFIQLKYFIVLIFSAFSISVAYSQIGPEWKYKLPITIDNSFIDNDLANWTLVFDQSFSPIFTQEHGPLDADGYYPSLNGGLDIRFSSDEDGLNELAVDVRSWIINNNPALATCEIAIKIPLVEQSNNTVIYMWWGNGTATPYGAGDPFGQYNAYDGNHLAVWTMNEDPSASAPQISNRARSSTNLTTHGGMASNQSVPAKVGNGLSLNLDYLESFDNLSRTNITIETITKPSAPTNARAPIIRSNSGNLIALTVRDGDFNYYENGSNQMRTPILQDTWYHLVYKRSGSNHYIIKNGIQTGTYISAAFANFNLNSFRIAHDIYGQYYAGIIDEFRISEVTRSNAWLKANYHNQFNTPGFLTFGPIFDYDEIMGAIDINGIMGGCTSNTAYTTSGATPDGIASTCVPTGPKQNRWFTFTAPASGFIRITHLFGTQRRGSMTLWEDDGMGGLAEVACSNAPDFMIPEFVLSSNVTPGATYYLSVDNYSSDFGTFGLCLNDTPDYDYVAGAIDINGLIGSSSATDAYTTHGATPDGDIPSCNPTGPKQNRWFSFNAPASGFIRITHLFGAQRRGSMTLWEDDGMGGLTEVACSNSPDFNIPEFVLSSPVTPGNLYYLSVDNYGNIFGTFGLQLDDSPDYDFVDGALDINSIYNGCSAADAYTTIGATPDGGVSTCVPINPNHNRWFTFTAQSGAIVIKHIVGTQFRGSMTLWKDDGMGGLAEVACASSPDFAFPEFTLNASGLSIGTTYYLSVDNYVTNYGTFGLCIYDDNYDYTLGALDVSGLIGGCSADAAYTTVGATPDGIASSCFLAGPLANRWFKLTVPASGELAFSVKCNNPTWGTMKDPVLTLWNSTASAEIDCATYAAPGDQINCIGASGLTVGSTVLLSVDVDDIANVGTFTLCVTDNVLAASFTLSEETICTGETATITMSGFQNSVTYQLRANTNDAPIGAPIAGTGNPITFDVTPAVTTTYNVLATNDVTACASELSDLATVTVNPLPDAIITYGTLNTPPSFTEQVAISTSAIEAWSVYSTDIDGDGHMDVLYASNDGKIAWYKNTDGAGTFGAEQTISTNVIVPYSVYAMDLDGDGDMDVLSASFNDNKIAWYENTDGDGTFGAQQVISTAALRATSVYSTDLDGDGDMDVLSSSFGDNKIAWYENDGTGNFGSQIVISTAALGAYSVYATDMDGDGDMDVLSASWTDNKIAWYENTDGAGTFGAQNVISTVAMKASSVYASDMDGDGDMDVVSASYGDDKIAWYENTDGDGTFGAQQVISTAALSTRSVYATDLDGDGDMDVLSASYADNKIAWYENTDGDGTFGAQQVISTAALGAITVYATDIDGDGDMDVLSANFTDDKIAWYKNDLLQPQCPGDIQFNEEGGDASSWNWSSSVAATFDDSSIQNPIVSELVDGEVITVDIIDAEGCTNSASAKIALLDTPLNSFTLTNRTICAGETATITQSGSEVGVTYQLRLNSDNTPVGAAVAGDGNSIDFNVSPTSTTEYNVLATNTTTGCEAELINKATVTVNPLPIVTFGGYEYSLPITIPAANVDGPDDLTDFPLLVSVDLDESHVNNANGYDIIFTDVNGAALDYERESYNAATGELLAWVRIPNLSTNTDTEIQVLYGNPAISTDQTNPTDVWNSDYSGVWHFENNVNDASLNGLNGTNNGTTDIAGQIGRARNYVGSSSQYIALPDNNPVGSNIDQFVFSAWIQIQDLSTLNIYMGIGNNGSIFTSNFIITGVRQEKPVLFVNSIFNFLNANNPISTSDWHYIVSIIDFSSPTDNLLVFVDGIFNGSTTSTFLPEFYSGVPFEKMSFGSNHLGTAFFYTGKGDEFRARRSGLTPGWIKTEYDNQLNPSTFLNIGAEQVNATLPELCVSDAAVILTGGTPAGGVYSGTGVSLSDSDYIFDPSVSGTGTFTLTYTYTDANSCTNSADNDITVVPVPAAPAVTDVTVCEGEFVPNLTAVGTNVLWYSDAGLTTQVGVGNSYNPLVSAPGVYTYYATQSTNGGCESAGTEATLTINGLPTASITYDGNPYCATGTASVTLTGIAGGTYSSTAGLSINAATGAIDLEASTPSTYTVTYSFTDANSCSNTTTTSVTINALPTATIDYSGSPYCATGTASVTLIGIAGGTYSSTAGLSINSTSGEIDLETSTAGTYTVTYSFTDANSCSNTTTTSVTIEALPTVTFGGYTYSLPITIPAANVDGPDDLTDFPLLVSVDLDESHVNNANGYDIIFTDVNGAALDYERESYNAATGELLAWVRIPNLSTSVDTDIKVLYGNAGISSDQSNPINVWGTNYTAVWHMENASIIDASINAYNGTNSGTVNAVGQIGQARNFVPNDYIKLPDNSGIAQNLSSITMSSWLNINDNTTNGNIQSYSIESAVATNASRASVVIRNDEVLYIVARATASDPAIVINGINAIPLVGWHYVVGIIDYSNSKIEIYIDGNLDISSNVSFSQSYSNNLPSRSASLGVDEDLLSAFYDGQGDEFRVARAPRTAGWIKTEYDNQLNPSAFLSIGAETANEELPEVCESDAAVILTGGTPAGGVYSGTGVSLFGSDYIFDPSVSGTGTFTLTYTYTDANSCTNSADNDITVVPVPAAPAVTDVTVCEGEFVPNLTAVGTNVLWYSDAGLTTQVGVGNSYNPLVSAPGVYTYYATQSTNGGCESAGTEATLTINGLPTASITYDGNPYCATGTASVTLTGIAGGTYSSTAGLSINAATGAIDLEASTPSTYTVTYSFTDANSCSNTTTTSVTINALPTATIDYSGSPYCATGTASVTLIGIAGGTYSSTAGLSINSTSGEIDLETSTAGTYTVTYSFTDANSCSNTTTTSVTIEALPTVTFGGYTYSLPITIPAANVDGPDDLTDFPLLVSVDLDESHVNNANGYDIIFTDVNGAALDYERESYNAATGELLAWVRIPNLSTSVDTDIKVLYGNAGISSDQSNPINVWGTNYTAVWHMENASIIDASINAYNGTNSGTVNAVGQIGQARNFVPNDYIKLPDNSGIAQNISYLTMSCWVDINNQTQSGNLQAYSIENDVPTSASRAALIILDNEEIRLRARALPEDPTTIITSNSSIPLVGWHHISGVVDFLNNTLKIYIDGNLDASSNVIFSQDYTSNLPSRSSALGANDDGLSNFYNGLGDEFRVARAPRTAGWIKTEYDNQLNPSAFLSIGAETANEELPEVCESDAAVILTGGTPAGGVYSGTGVSLSDSDYIFDPSVSGTGTFTLTYTYTDANSCTNSADNDITVVPVPAAPAVTDVTVCEGEFVPNLTAVGTNVLWYSDAGLTTQVGVGNSYNPLVSAPGVYTYYATQSTNGGCESAGTEATLTINGLPTASITYDGNPYCATGTASVTLTGIAGGTYSSTAGLSINAATGAIDLEASTPSTYTVTYSFTDANSCSNTTTTSVTINALPTATIDYSGSPYCATGTASVTLIGIAGGTYSSTAGLSINSTSGEIDLETSTAGTYTVTYSFTDANSCSNTTTTSVTIEALPTVTFGGYTYSLPITIPAANVDGPDDLTDFPLLVSVDLDESHVNNANGYDIIFTDVNGAALDYERESYNAATGELLAWVRIPNLSTSVDTDIKVLYGNAGISSDQSNPINVWGTNYTAVWHMENASIIDASINAYNGTNSGTVNAVGQIGQARNFVPNDYIKLPDNSGIAQNISYLTMSCWVDINNQTQSGNLQAYSIENDVPTSASRAALIILDNEEIRLRARALPEDPTTIITSNSSIPLVGWHHISGVVDFLNNTLKIYIDGNLDASSNVIFSQDYTSNLPSRSSALGANDDGLSNFYNGLGDEFRVARAPRTAGWIKTEYDNQLNPSAFLSIGAETANEELPEVCESDAAVILTGGTPAGGVYSGTGVSLSDSDYIFDPSVSGTGTFTLTYTYTDANSCTNSADNDITVVPVPAAPAVTDVTVCEGEFVPNLTAVGTNVLWYSDAGLTTQVGVGNSYNPLVSAPGVYTYYATQSTNGGCESAGTEATLTINGLPTASITYDGNPYCATGTASVTLTGIAGGTYSSTAGLSINAATGAIDLEASTPSTYTVTYSFTDANSCSNTTTTSVTINALPTATIDYSGSPYCATGTASVTLIGIAGGTYSSTAGLSINSTSGEIDLETSTAGTYTVTYSFTDANSCSNTASTNVTVNALPEVLLTASATELNCYLTTISISSTPTVQGTATYLWSNGATTQDITVTNPGTYNVVVTDSDNGCTVTSSDVVINQDITAPSVTVSADATELTCANSDVLISSTPTVQGIATYLWSNGATTQDITVTNPGTYNVVVTDSDNGCTVTSSDVVIDQDITAPSVTVSADATELTCANSDVLISSTPTVQGTSSYLWSNGATTQNITVTTPGTYNVVVTDSDNGCTVTSSDVVINQDITAPSVVVSADATELTCANSDVLISSTPTVQGTSSYLWSNGATTQNITVTTPGTYNVVVTDSDNGCTVTSSDVVIAQDITAPSVTVSADATELTCANSDVLISSTPTVQGTATYLWSNGATTQNITVTTPGTYNVVVTDSHNGCTVTSSDVVINQDITAPSVTVSADATELTCANSDVLISSTPTVQGTSSYLWSNGATTQNIIVTNPGTYNVVVTDSDNGCTVTSSDVVIAQDITAPSVTVSADATELTCANSDVLISSTPTVQGTSSYLWSNGATTQNITVTIPGTYNVVVTDSDNGCTVTSSDVVITQDITVPSVVVSADATELTCANSDVLISSTPTVQGTSSYLWSNGATTQDITVTNPGTYNVVVTDSHNGCTVTSSDVVINQDITAPSVVVSADATELTCANSDVLISSTPTVQGTSSYLWSNGATTQNITVTIPGTYNVVVTDSDNGCTVTSSDVVINQDITAPSVTVSADATELTCANSDVLISSTPTVQGTSTYLWSNGATTQNITVTIPGTYNVVVTDSDNGCTVTSSDVVINQDITAPSVTVSADATELTCANSDVLISSTPTVQGTSSYLWSNGATTQNITVTTPGTYNVVVTDSDNGCTVTSSDVVINQDITVPSVVVSADATELTCANSDVLISSTPTVQGTSSYLWSNGATTQNITVTTPGTYNVVVTDSDNGCSVTSSDVVITQDVDVPTADAGPGGELNCTTMTITLDGTGSTITGVSYLWTTSGTGIINSGATTLSPVVSGPGTYTLTVTNTGTGCEASDVVEIAQDITAPSVTVSADATELTCANSDVLISSTPTVQGTSSYLWSNGATTQNITVTTPGTYNVVVTDSDNGCTVTSSDVVITQDVDVPTADAGPGGELNCTTMTITLDGTGSTITGVSYLWTTSGTGIINSGATTMSPVVSGPGTYTLTVTNTGTGCEASDVVEIAQDITAPSVTVSADATELTCANSDVLISSTPTVQGTSSYLWSNGATTQNITVTTPGTYNVVVTDSDNGCTVTSSDVVINQDITAPSVVVSADATELTCANSDVLISSTPTVQGTSSYLWSNGATTQNITVTTPGTYNVVVTDSDNGCTVTSSDVVINQDITAPSVVVSADATELTCANSDVLISSTPTVQGTSSYLWSNGATTQNITVTTPGTYNVVVTDSDNGCTVTSSDVVINQDITAPSVVVSADATELTCANSDVLISSTPTVQGTSSYLWSNGATTQNITVTTPGTYNVVVTDSDNGCTVTSSDVVINQDITVPSVVVSADATELTCANSDVLISSTPTVQGTSSYLWSNGATTQNITVTIPGTYNVVVTDSDNGCSVTSSDVVINQDITAPSVTVSADATELTCANSDVLISSTPTVQGIATYLWSNGATTQNITVTTPGTYNVVVTDSDNGCTVTSSDVVINQDITAPSVVVSADATELTCANSDVLISSTPTVQGTSSYLWSNGATTQNITVTTPGTYNVVVTDSDNGCTVTSSDVVINQDITAPSVVVSADATELTCANSDVLISSTPTVQGTSSYLWSNGATTQNITVTTPGTYNVVVTDSDNGCTVTSSDVVINQDITVPSVVVSADATELTCANSDVLISSTPTVQGTSSYLWSNGATTQNITVTIPGTYNVVVTDSDNGCSVTSSDVVINQDITAPSVTVSADATELTCANSDVLISSTPTVQGIATYLWSNGATTQNITVTTPGTYNVVVTDSDNGCTVTSSDVVINQDITAPSVVVSADATELTCANSDVLISSTPTVQGTSSYLWSNGATTQNITVTIPGTYNVVVTDSDNGCTVTSSDVVINQDITAPSVVLSADATELTCANSDVLISSTPTVQGTSSYLWSNGATTQNITVTTPGTYNVVVTDSDNGCTVTSSDVVIIEDVLEPTVSVSSNNTELPCPNTGVVISSVANVQGTATYLWSNGATTQNITVTTPDTYNVVVTDSDNGCSVTSSDVVITEDNTPPTAVCQDVTVSLDAAGEGSLTAIQVNNGSSDNCTDSDNLILSIDKTSFDCSDIGNTTVTLTVEDENGNTATCSSTVTIEDERAPTAVCQNITINLDGAGNASIVPSDVDGGSSDNCSLDNAAFTITPNAFTSADLGDNNVTFTVYDMAGNSASCTAVVTVTDITPPTAVCQNITVNLDASGNVSIVGTDIDGGSTDNGTIVSYVASPDAFTCANTGANLVTLTVTDDAGLTDQCTATVTVVDNIAPTMLCQNITVQLDASGNASIVPADINNGSFDNCSVALSLNITDFSCADVGDNPVVLTGTDPSGKSATCNATVTVEDNIDPTITCAPDQSQSTDLGSCDAAVTVVAPTFSDNCAGAVLTNNITGTSDASGTYAIGTTAVIWTVTDASGNTAQCTQDITVTDDEDPVISCPVPDASYDMDPDECNATLSFAAIVTDNCGAGTIIYRIGANVITFPYDFTLGTTTVTATAEDTNGNTSSCDFDVRVIDNQKPIPLINNLPDILSDCIISNIIAPKASDNCGVEIEGTQSHPLPVKKLGTTVITWVYDDGNGNLVTQDQNLIIEDTIKPVITACPFDLTVSVDEKYCGSAVTWIEPAASDNCNFKFTSNYSIGDFFPVGTTDVLYTAADSSGNSSVCKFTVTVLPALPPEITGSQEVCPEIEYTYSTELIPEVQYIWEVSGGILSGSTSSNQVNVIWEDGNEEGELKVRLTSLDDCFIEANYLVDISSKFELIEIRSDVGLANAPSMDYFHLICSEDSNVRYYTEPGGAYIYNWQVTGGSIIQSQANEVIVNWGNQTGDRNISVSVISGFGCESNTINAKVYIDSPSLDLGNDLEICKGDYMELAPEGNFAHFEWHDGSTANTYLASKTEMVRLNVTDNFGCSASDEVNVEAFDSPMVDLGRDTSLCGTETLRLYGGDDGVYFNWSTGETSPEIIVYEGMQVITLEVANEIGCKSYDTININSCSTVERFTNMPTGFTPNGDGKNDVWRIPELEAFPQAVVEVFDRWGILIYRSEPGYNDPWNGVSKNGKEMPMDAYYFVIDLNYEGAEVITGTVTIIR